MTKADLPDRDRVERVGGYRVVRRLATGGTSDVLLARAEGPLGFERNVVLKVLLSQFRDDDEFARMFAREASAYARLSHPSIVRLFDFFALPATTDAVGGLAAQLAGQLVMVLEHVDGPPLSRFRSLLKSAGAELDDRAAIYVASCVFDALAAAHATLDESGNAAPVIHRDVNPSNILLPYDGQVKLADFGVAKVTGLDAQSVAGMIKGTYGYMAPEQVTGEVVTPRTDVYAAGVVLWELLTKRKAFHRGALPEMEALRAMAEPRLTSIDLLRPDVHKAIRDALKRALEPRGKQRTITAEEMVAILGSVVRPEEGRERLVGSLDLVRKSTAGGTTADEGPAMSAFAAAAHALSARTGGDGTRDDRTGPVVPTSREEREEREAPDPMPGAVGLDEQTVPVVVPAKGSSPRSSLDVPTPATSPRPALPKAAAPPRPPSVSRLAAGELTARGSAPDIGPATERMPPGAGGTGKHTPPPLPSSGSLPRASSPELPQVPRASGSTSKLAAVAPPRPPPVPPSSPGSPLAPSTDREPEEPSARRGTASPQPPRVTPGRTSEPTLLAATPRAAPNFEEASPPAHATAPGSEAAAPIPIGRMRAAPTGRGPHHTVRIDEVLRDVPSSMPPSVLGDEDKASPESQVVVMGAIPTAPAPLIPGSGRASPSDRPTIPHPPVEAEEPGTGTIVMAAPDPARGGPSAAFGQTHVMESAPAVAAAVPAAPSARPSGPTPIGAAAPAEGPRGASSRRHMPTVLTRPKRSAAGLLVGLVVLASVVAVGSVGYLRYERGRALRAPAATEAAATAALPPAASLAASAAELAARDVVSSAPAPVEAPSAAPSNAPAASVEATPTPAGSAAAPVEPRAAPAGVAGDDVGTVKTAGAAPHRRIFLDEKVVGQTPETVSVKCGKHVIRLGSTGKPQPIDVPCGGELVVGDKL